jgi:predicted amidohydrolase YtcJ
MNRTSFSWLAAPAAAVLCAAITAPPAHAAEAADLILSNGDVYTGGAAAQSIAIRDGVIIDIGTDDAMAQHRAASTKVLDLKGAAVVPGLHDMHVHPMGSGQLHSQCIWPQGSPPEKVLETVKGCVAKHAKGEWISGGQWDATSFGKQPVHRSLLDRVAPDNPVALMDISVHALWLNSKALQLAGITTSTPNPEGGVIERDAKGEPTGVVRESARALVQSVIPPPTPEQNAAALKWALDEMLSHGITALTDAGIDENGLQAYATLADRGVLKQRVRGCIGYRAGIFGTSKGSVSDAIGRRNLYARERFKPDCIKIVLDGVPTEGHTAAMVEPYADVTRVDDPRAKGMLMVPAGTLKAAVIDFDRRGLTVKFHAAGDAAVRAGLDAIEAARKANGFSGLLHDVGHNSFVQTSDIARARALGATFEMSPYIWYPNPIIPDIQKAIGPERMKRWIPVKEAIDSGALVVPGSDWAVVPSVNPWLAIETLVTRQKPGGGGEVLGAAEKITLQQAFDLFTVSSARQMGNAMRTGRIERGLLADLVVVDRNPFKIPVTQIHDTRVLKTIINGEVVYEAPHGDVSR